MLEMGNLFGSRIDRISRARYVVTLRSGHIAGDRLRHVL